MKAVSSLAFASILLASASMLSACTNPGEEACETLLETFVDKLSDECGLMGESEVRSTLDGMLDCEDAVDVRDEVAFYDDCIPAIEALSCADLAVLTLPASCVNQILMEG